MAVFNLLRDYLKGEVEAKGKPRLLKKMLPGASKEKAPPLEGGDKKNKIFVFFMTDGCDTCSDAKSILMVRVFLWCESTYSTGVVKKVGRRFGDFYSCCYTQFLPKLN